MKFEYDDQIDARDCVAFLDGDNDLWVFRCGDWICVSGDYEDNAVSEGDACVKFYPGDKITITF